MLGAAADTERLPDPDAARLRELVQRADIEALARRSPLRGRGADRFQYDLRVDDAETHEVTTSEDAASAELRELIEWVLEHGQ